MMIGRSGSPSRNSTITSMPMRGVKIAPHCGPASHCAHADEARALVVLVAVAVPMELDFDAAVFVAVDLFARRSDDDGGMRTVHDRLRRQPRRPKLGCRRNAGEAVGVIRRDLLSDEAGVVGGAMVGRRDRVAALFARDVVPDQRELGAG